MKTPLLLLALLCIAYPAHAAVTNLNATSNLTDEGIDPPAAGLRLVTPNILDGIPLMQGLQLVDSNTPPTVKAVGILDVDDIYDFYKLALPDLGWTAAGGRDYTKGSETLHINAQADNNGKSSIVTFTEKNGSEGKQDK